MHLRFEAIDIGAGLSEVLVRPGAENSCKRIALFGFAV